jgi:hypothetical protein
MGNPFGADRASENRAASDEAELSNTQSTFKSKALANINTAEDLQATGDVTAPQQAELDKYNATQKAINAGTFANMGIESSTMKDSVNASVDMNTLIQKGSFNRQDVADYMSYGLQEMGISDTAQANLINLHEQLRQEDDAANAAMIGAAFSIMSSANNPMGSSSMPKSQTSSAPGAVTDNTGPGPQGYGSQSTTNPDENAEMVSPESTSDETPTFDMND